MKRLIYILFILLSLASCATTINPNLIMDLTEETVPIMLTPVDSTAPQKTFRFSSGVSVETFTVSTSTGKGQSVNTTYSISSDQNNPLKDQIHNLFVQDPKWTKISKLTFNQYYLAGWGLSKDKKLLKIELTAPVKKEL